MRKKWNSENLKHSVLWLIFSIVTFYYSLFSLSDKTDTGINWVYYLIIAFAFTNSFFAVSNINRDLKLEYWVNHVQLSEYAFEVSVEANILKNGQITSLKINGTEYPVTNEDPGHVIIRVIKMNNRLTLSRAVLVVEYVPWPINKYFLRAYV